MSMKNNLDLSGIGECGRALVATTQCTRSGYLDLIGWEIILRVLHRGPKFADPSFVVHVESAISSKSVHDVFRYVMLYMQLRCI